MAIEDFDSFNSQTKKGKRLENLFIYELEKEADWYNKQVEKFKKQLDEAPFNSAKQTSAARSLDLATATALDFQQYLVYRAKNYVPTEGYQLASSKKEIAFADKYKNVDTSVYSEKAGQIRENYNKYDSGPRNVYAVSPVALEVAGSVSSGKMPSLGTVTSPSQQKQGSVQGPFVNAKTQSSSFNQQPGAAGQGKDYGNTKPSKPVTGDTYTNTKNVKFTYQNNKWVRTATLGGTETPGTTVVVDGKKVTQGSEQWKSIIQQEFGSLWDVYNGNADVKAVIDKSVKEGWFNDQNKLTSSLQNTGWYRTTEQSARQFAIKQSTDPATLEDSINAKVDDLRAIAIGRGTTFSDATLRKLATDQIKFGYSEQQTLNAIGSEEVAQAQLGGAQGLANLRQGSTARNLRQKASAYYQKVSDTMIDQWTQEILTGKKSETQFDELMRNSARTQFRSLQPALDRGDDVKTAMYAYEAQAQATLGSAIDTSQIDWTQDKWNKALNFRDEKSGEYRQMDLWEWNKYLRTLPEWQNTEDAKNVYGNLVQSLARGFGKTA
jgi:hypothetical protein